MSTETVTPITKPTPAASTAERSTLYYSALAATKTLLDATMRGDAQAWATLKKAHDLLVVAARARGAR